MKKLLLLFPIFLLTFTLTSCSGSSNDRPKTPPGETQVEKDVTKIFSDTGSGTIRKFCERIDMVYIFNRYDQGSIFVVPNHPDCTTETTQP